jgi:hypothetical protein
VEGDTSAAARVVMADSAHLLTHPVHDLQDEALGCEKKSMNEPCLGKERPYEGGVEADGVCREEHLDVLWSEGSAGAV